MIFVPFQKDFMLKISSKKVTKRRGIPALGLSHHPRRTSRPSIPLSSRGIHPCVPTHLVRRSSQLIISSIHIPFCGLGWVRCLGGITSLLEGLLGSESSVTGVTTELLMVIVMVRRGVVGGMKDQGICHMEGSRQYSSRYWGLR
jgi:hypothetical protein